MSSLFEKYSEIYKKLKAAKDKFDSAQRSVDAASARDTAEKELHIERLQDLLVKVDDYMAKVESYRKLAEEHIKSRNILTITPRELNFGRMRDWSSKINPGIEDDPYAQRVYVLAKCNEMYLEQKKRQFERKIVELQQSDEQASKALIEAASRVMRQQEGECLTIIESREFLEFAEELQRTHKAFTDPDRLQTLTDDPIPQGKTVGIGGYALPLPILGSGVFRVKALLPDHFDAEAGSVLLPVELEAETPSVISVACTAGREKRLYRAIQHYLLSVISNSPVGENKIYVLDALHYNNTSLGALRPLVGSVVMEEIPRDSEAIADTLRQIVSEFSDIDETIGVEDSITEYNRTANPEERIPRKTLVLIGYPSAFSGDAANLIQRILINFERYGVTLITVNTHYTVKKNETDNYELPVELAQGYVRIRMFQQKTLIRFNNESEFHFRWYEFTKQELNPSFQKAVGEHSTRANTKGNEYIKRFDLTDIEFLKKGRGNKKILLPYGVDNRDQVHSAAFNNENFASFLMGASGSGKSTLLHTLITGILRNYHPDDVELWLADFKMAEFSQYIDPMPPHVKYILLDESPELVFDLIDRLTDKLMERQRFFMRAENRDFKKVENVPSKDYMPIIFVILDEFSIMSQAIEDNSAYKLKLQNLLAKGRSNGIKFIFSSQTFSKGVVGLTGTAKEQIQMRIAMKNSKDEINLALEVAASERTEQVQGWIDALPPHYALYKHYDSEEKKNKIEKLLVMYFKEDAQGRNAYAPQRKMIEEINRRMRPVEEYSPENVECYLDKHPVVVDGNSFDAFSARKCLAEIEKNRENPDFNGDEIFCYLGTPRLMYAMREIAITPESRQNMLLIGDSSERSCVCSIISSMLKCFDLQEKDAEIWTYERNRIYRSMRDSDWQAYPILNSIEEIGDAIAGLKREILEDQVQGEKLIVLLGFENVCADFEFATPETTKSKKPVKTIALPTDGMLAPNAQEDEESARIRALLSAATANQSDDDELPDDTSVLSGSDMDALFASLVQNSSQTSFDQPAAEKKTDAPAAEKSEKENAAAKTPEKEDDAKDEGNAEAASGEKKPEPQNPKEDLKFCLQQGSRKGVHFLLVLSNFGDLRQTGLSLQLFRHRMAFRLSKDDSREIFSSPNASDLPEHICYYSDTMDRFSFRPYLHKGISWDGWGLDDFGRVISPLEADEE